jgi:hypothetical protein
MREHLLGGYLKRAAIYARVSTPDTKCPLLLFSEQLAEELNEFFSEEL